MEKKVIIANKGYTIGVVSWENDGDNYKTKSMTVEDKDYALAILQMCKDIFTSRYNGKNAGIGNTMDNDYEKARNIIINYIADKPIITKGETDPDVIVDMVMDINYELMGSSEHYYSRVFESGVVYYTPEDIIVDEIAS